MNRAAEFHRFRGQFLETFYRSRPVDATFTGRHDFDATLPDVSPGGVAAASRELGELARMSSTLPHEPLESAEAVDHKLIDGALRLMRSEIDSRHLLNNPSWYTGEAVFGMFSLLLTEFAPEPDRLERLARRMERIPLFLDQARAQIRSAATPTPTPWVQRAKHECEGALAFFSDGFAHLKAPPEVESAAEGAREAFSALVRALDAETGETPSHAGMSIGSSRFEELLAHGHFIDESPSHLASRAEAELSECRRALEDASEEWRAELAGLEDLHPSRDHYLDSFRECLEQCRSLARQQNLLSWPDYPIDYVARPRWARAAAPHLYFLFYRSPAPFDSLERVRYLVPPLENDASDEDAERLLRSMNDSVIKLNHVVHHGGIGHHVQNWHAQRADSEIGKIAAVDGASRIALTCGGTMAEGWACYATDLMDEAGFLTPLESLSQHHAHARMAARAVVDTRLHCGDMSFQQAVDYYVEQTNMSPAAAHAEATKNSMFPAAGVIYFLGSQGLHALRERVRNEAGATFDVAAFHDEVLSHGSIPVSLIAEAMLKSRARTSPGERTKGSPSSSRSA